MSFVEILPSRISRRAATGGVLALAVIALTGCVVAPLPPPGPVVMQPGPGPVLVAPMAPPPVVVEPVIAAPAPGYVWIGGYWSWVGSRHVWTRGRWEAPRAGYRWVPRTWERGPNGWHQHGGHWAR